ncbi:hypothetical protein FGO68_gene13808 [Halteria grandinella]|uniref:tRNA (adenine(58)-N(1))-methyltransferase non-catalytic subunit TRM6 n=1 Tax=Halteria grandinella TaxID=5974 RepID=A0A8J8T1S1_HALGN|nr:hypothetical protein FGO68_gene13808 [Halteria grandinella]
MAPVDGVVDKDNRDIVDNNTAQKLTQVEIEALKRSGMKGGDLIKHIVENSESWNKRTKFSQEKYLKKKMQKYAVTFEIKKPTALELCEAYTQTQPQRILSLRADTLGLMMQMANINQESRVLLIDKTRGLLAGALIEKNVKEILHVELGGGGQQIKMQTDILMEYNLHPYQQKRLSHTHISNIQKTFPSPTVPADQRDQFLTKLAPAQKHYYNSVIFLHDEFHPIEIIDAVFDLIQPSAPIVVFHTHLHILSQLRDHLTISKMVIMTKLEELWTREQQVLPMRTHPHMSMHGASGFLFSGIKVL